MFNGLSTKSTRQKALTINLDTKIYGTFAEIGAGQEVARWFFNAGSASGTIAKSMSAYDMVFSDTIYGKSSRYVSQDRLNKMLDYEYDLLEERLRGSRGIDTQFFTYANTVSTRGYHSKNEPHGWMGVKTKSKDEESCSSVHIHVRFLDLYNPQQQEALGVVGVSLIYSTFFKNGNIDDFLNSLLENLEPGRIEIDMIKTSGPKFEKIDDRLLNLKLVQQEITSAILFDENCEILLASDELYKKDVLVTRGSYRPPTLVNFDMIEKAKGKFCTQNACDPDGFISIAEITMGQLTEDGALADEDFLARVDLITSLGQKVLITKFPQYFLLTNFFHKLRVTNLSIVLGIYNFKQIFDQDYNKLDGGILEALGTLFRPNTTLFLYPLLNKDGEIVTFDKLDLGSQNIELLEFIKKKNMVIDIDNYNPDILHIYSRKVLKMIRENADGWQKLVPSKIAKMIQDKNYFKN